MPKPKVMFRKEIKYYVQGRESVQKAGQVALTNPMLPLRSRRDEIWESKRRARMESKKSGMALPAPPPRVVPETGEAGHPQSGGPSTHQPPLMDHHEAFEDHGIPTHHGGGDEGGMMPSSSSLHEDPVFQALVEAEMRKMEEQFQSQLHMKDGGHDDYVVAEDTFTTPVKREPLPAELRDGQREALGTVDSPSAAIDSRGLGRGPHSFVDTGLGGTPPKPSINGAAGFGRGLQSLYSGTSTEEKRRHQQEYARQLSEQLQQKGLREGQMIDHPRGNHRMAVVGDASVTSLQLDKAGKSPPRRYHGGLDKMYEDPDERARHLSEKQKYAQALNEQLAERRWRSDEGLRSRFATSGFTPSSTNPSLAGSPRNLATPDSIRKAKDSEKKAAYAAALKQQMIENEEKKRQEKELAKRGDDSYHRLGASAPSSTAIESSGYPSTGTHYTSPEAVNRPQWSSPHGEVYSHTLPPSAPVPMSEARRRLVRDVYGRTSPWAPQADPVPMMAAGQPRTHLAATYSPAAGAPLEAYTSPSHTSPIPGPHTAVLFQASPGPRPSFARHGYLSYDPNLQETLRAKQQAALEQREALQRQIDERRRMKEQELAKRKAEEEAEIRRLEEETRREAAEKEAEQRRKEAEQQEAMMQAQMERELAAQREADRMEAERLQIEKEQREEERTKRVRAASVPPRKMEISSESPSERRPTSHSDSRDTRVYGAGVTGRSSRLRPDDQGGNNTLLFQRTARERGGRMKEVLFGSPGSATVPRVYRSPSRHVGRMTRGGGDGMNGHDEDPLEQSLGGETSFISLSEGDDRSTSLFGTRQVPSPQRRGHLGQGSGMGRTTSPYRRSRIKSTLPRNHEDEMDLFVDSWQKRHNFNAPPASSYNMTTNIQMKGREGMRKTAFQPEDSLQGESTFMYLTPEEREEADRRGEMSTAETQWVQGGPTNPASPLTELLRNHQEIQPDGVALKGLKETYEAPGRHEAFTEGDTSYEADIHEEGDSQQHSPLRDISSVIGNTVDVTPRDGSARRKWNVRASDIERQKVLDDIRGGDDGGEASERILRQG